MYACERGHFECVAELLMNGANENIHSYDNLYPIDYAINNGHIKVGNFFLNFEFL